MLIQDAYVAGKRIQSYIEDINSLIKSFDEVENITSLIDLYLTTCLKYNIKNNNQFMVDLLQDETKFNDVCYSLKLGLIAKEDMLSFKEAAERWGINRTTIQHAKQSGRLTKDEWEKIGRNLYVKVSAMQRLFGDK